MNELDDLDDDILACLNDDKDVDSADEILELIDESNQNDNLSKCFAEDDGIEDDTETKIAELQAQIELLKSKKSPLANSKKEVEKAKNNKFGNQKPTVNNTTDFVKTNKSCRGETTNNETSIHESTNNESCKHGKPVSQCFFCSCKSAIPKSPVNREEKNINDLRMEIDKGKEGALSNKRRLAHKASDENPHKKIKSMKKGKEELDSKLKERKKEIPGIEDKPQLFGGIEISVPLVSSTILDERMKGRKLIKISKIQSTVKDEVGDWVTIGVIVNKVTQKKSSSGKNFCVWHLSDLGLGTENQIVALFLFGESYSQHWKIQVGTAIALLNPTLLKQDKYSSQGTAINIDNPRKLMELGYAKQLSQCKGVRKSDGKFCTMYVNKKYGEYCEYHVQSAFKKAKAGRMECQSGGRVPTKGKLIQNLKKEISQGAVHYGGQTVVLKEEKFLKSNPKASGNREDNKNGLKSVMGRDILQEAAKQFNLIKTKREMEMKQLSSGPLSAKTFLNDNKSELLNLSPANNVSGSLCADKVKLHNQPLMATKRFDNIRKPSSPAPNKYTESKCEDKLKRKQCDIPLLTMKESENHCKKLSPKEKSKAGSSLVKPVLGRGLNGDNLLDFGEDHLSYDKYTGEMPQDPIAIPLKKHNKMNDESNDKVTESIASRKSTLAKRHAISIVQYKGPIALPDSNPLVGKKPKSKEIIMKRLEKSSDGDSIIEKSVAKNKSLLAGVLGKIDLSSESGKKLLQQKSKHVGAVRLAESEQEEKYFESLEKKENMQAKMSNTYEIKVTGVACRECQYLAESQSQLCRDLKHPVAKINNVVKRFFACKNCKQRCCAYNKLIPKKPCSRCGETNFEKAPMAVERKGPLIGSETLEVRGREQKYTMML